MSIGLSGQLVKRKLTDIRQLLLSESASPGNLQSITQNNRRQVSETREEDQTSEDDLPTVQVECIDRNCRMNSQVSDSRLSTETSALTGKTDKYVVEDRQRPGKTNGVVREDVTQG